MKNVYAVSDLLNLHQEFHIITQEDPDRDDFKNSFNLLAKSLVQINRAVKLIKKDYKAYFQICSGEIVAESKTMQKVIKEIVEHAVMKSSADSSQN